MFCFPARSGEPIEQLRQFNGLETYVYIPGCLSHFQLPALRIRTSPLTTCEVGLNKTESPSVVSLLQGDHFFIQTDQATLLGMIRQELGRL